MLVLDVPSFAMWLYAEAGLFPGTSVLANTDYVLVGPGHGSPTSMHPAPPHSGVSVFFLFSQSSA